MKIMGSLSRKGFLTLLSAWKLVLRYWNHFFALCKIKIFFQPEAATDAKKVTINNDGYFKIEFTALMTSTDNKITRVEVYKVTSKDPTNSCGAITTACTTLIQLRFNSKVYLILSIRISINFCSVPGCSNSRRQDRPGLNQWGGIFQSLFWWRDHSDRQQEW